MNLNCPKCDGQTKIVPAGISKKTGRPYDSFFSCLDRECGGTMKIQNAPRPNDVNPSVLLMDEIKRIDTRIDNASKQFVELEIRLKKLENGK